MFIAPKIFVEYSSEDSNEKVELTELLRELRSIINDYRKISQPTEQVKNDSPLISLSQLAERLDKSESTIHNWKRQGLIPFKRIGRPVFFSEDDVKDALNSIPAKKNKNKMNF